MGFRLESGECGGGAVISDEKMSEPRRLTKPILILWAVTALGFGIAMWLKFVHDIRYFGPVPSLVLFVLPGLLGMCLTTITIRRRQPINLVVMYCGILMVVVGLLILVKWS